MRAREVATENDLVYARGNFVSPRRRGYVIALDTVHNWHVLPMPDDGINLAARRFPKRVPCRAAIDIKIDSPDHDSMNPPRAALSSSARSQAISAGSGNRKRRGSPLHNDGPCDSRVHRTPRSDERAAKWQLLSRRRAAGN